MDFLQPGNWKEALAMKAERPEAIPIAGGTDVMVELNLDHNRPPALMDLTRLPELTEWGIDGGLLRIGAGVTYARIIKEIGAQVAGLAMASRTVGSPQIRNRGTVGGNLGTSSPAGDALPPLLAAGAEVELASRAGTRRVKIDEFFTGPKRNSARPDELIAAFLIEPARGPQQFSKVGTRNAMVIAVCSFSLALDASRHRVRTGIGSAAPTPFRATAAEVFIEHVLDEHALWGRRVAPPASAVTRFGELVAEAAQPIDDIRGTAAYRRRALSVLARRSFTWAWDSFRKAGWA